jgi:hypothetical protein
MATQEQVEMVRRKIADLLKNLRSARTSDGETMFIIGLLAGRILIDAKQPHWAQMKRRLSAAEYDQILLTAQNQGNDLFRAKDMRAAFALDVVTTSIVGSRFTDEHITQGVELLDDTIERAIANWRKSNTPDQTTH